MVTYCLTHPIQYQSPLIRHLVSNGLTLHVAYASAPDSSGYYDKEFGQSVSWDIPLLEGYPHSILNSIAPTGSHSHQARLFETQLKAEIATRPPSALWVHGWNHPYTRAAWKIAREKRIPLLLRGETSLASVKGSFLRRLAHRGVFTLKFRQPAAFLAVGSLNKQLYRSYGVPDRKIFDVPYAVDNAFFQARAAEARPNRTALRASLGLTPDQPIVLFCGKLIPKKDPERLLRAFASLNSPSKADSPPPALVFVGDGELRPHLEQLATQIAPGQVHFTGFKNQTELPAFYDLCDLFVIPSLFEPWGLVVNEVMNAAKPVIASSAVCSAPDLIDPRSNGAIFPAGDLTALTSSLHRFLSNPPLLKQAGQASLNRINSWSFQQALHGFQSALASIA